MCEEFCLVCEQCDKFRNGCQGQRGSFFFNLCPTMELPYDNSPEYILSESV